MTKEKAIILTYHSVSEGSGYDWAVRPDAFAKQMAYLAATGRSVISLTELVRRIKARELLMGAVAITFDDGYRDNLSAALPILAQYGFPATLFLTTGATGKTNKYGLPYLSREELRTLEGTMLSVESHTVSHPMLAKIPIGDARREIGESKHTVMEFTGRTAGLFAYPYGNVNDIVVHAVQDAGYEAAVTTEARDVRVGDDLYLLPRYLMRGSTTFATFRGIVACGRPFYRAAQYLVGYHPFAEYVRKAVQRVWAWSEGRGWNLISKPLFRLLLWRRSYPVLLTSGEMQWIIDGKAVARSAQERALGMSARTIDAAREDMVSIGIFAYERLDLLMRTCESLQRYLTEYGDTFRHEVLFIHDGQNSEIEAWAKAQPLFDGVHINTTNEGLSKNINQFWFEMARGRYVLNLEDDWACEYSDNFILHALGVLQTNDAVGAVHFERRQPDDYRRWNRAFKIGTRVLSSHVYETPEEHRYRVFAKGSYRNSCALYRFSSLALTGRLRDAGVPRRDQEGDYIRRYNRFWLGARGVAFKDSPFLHIGEGRSASTWSQ